MLSNSLSGLTILKYDHPSQVWFNYRLPHNNFSSVYRIFTKLGHMIPLWKGKDPIYVGVIRSKVKVTVTINRIFNNRVVST
jgi:hypothetical protein